MGGIEIEGVIDDFIILMPSILFTACTQTTTFLVPWQKIEGLHSADMN